MEVKVISNASRSNRKNEDHYHKIKRCSSMKRHHDINQNMCRISRVMYDLVPKSRHFADDVNLLEFTIEYLKQTADFQRGVGLCAEETKIFLKQHIFDKSKISALFEKIQQRIDYISAYDHNQTKKCEAAGGLLKQQNTMHIYEVEDYDQSCSGVLLDLSMKQNRLADEAGRNSNSATIRNLCTKLKKREILDKIRKKILDKRGISNISEKVKLDHDDVWRPWRF